MDFDLLYTELIMEHNASTHNRKKLDSPDISERGHNPSCGDDITLEIKFKDDIVEDLAFSGHGCAISQASTSMMIDLVKGKSKDEVLKLIDTFTGMIKREITSDSELEILEDAMVLKNICNMPARVKCAVLSWHTLKEIIK